MIFYCIAMETSQLENKVELMQQRGFVKNYKSIFMFTFKHFFPLLVVVLAIVFFQGIFFSGASDSWEVAVSLEKINLVHTFETFLDQATKDKDTAIHIIQWTFLQQDDFLITHDNLVTYQWFIMPKNLTLSTQLPLKPISYFDAVNYDITELERFVKHIVLVDQEASSYKLKNTQIAIHDGLVNTFNLSCFLENKILTKSCSHYLEEFFQSFFVYQLSMDYAWLQSISTTIQQKDYPSYQKLFCESMKKYILYSNDDSQELTPIFNNCGSGYSDFYKRISFFIDIQKQLGEKYISADVYKDPLLNAYKLLSYQQILYRDFASFKIRRNQYTAYLAYVEALIKRDAISPFYKDEIYRYNTHYLKPTLLTIRHDNRRPGIKDTEVMQIVKNIDLINNWNVLGYASGLRLSIKNPELLRSTATVQTQDTTNIQDHITKGIANITYFVVAQSAIVGDTIGLEGYFLVADQKIASKLQLIYTNSSFLVSGVDIIGYPELTQTLQWLISSRVTSIWELFVVLETNLSSYQNQTSGGISDILTMCDEVKELETTLSMQVVSCTPDILVINKLIGWTVINYSFLLDGMIPTSIKVSDAKLQKEIDAAIQEENFRFSSIEDVITFALSTSKTSSPIIHAWSTNTLLTIEDFQKFLKIEINDIAEKGSTILVDFSIQGINFIANYDITKHNFKGLYFKDILRNGQPYPIKNFVLTLEESNQKEIDLFLQDPLNHIKEIDFTAWKNFMEKKK